MRKRISITVISVFMTFMMMVGFQNCASDVPNLENNSASLASNNPNLPGPKLKYSIGTVTQNQALQTVGGTWSNVPGAYFEFNIPKEMNVIFRAQGALTSVAGTTYTSGHCGIRFVIDDVIEGDTTFGDVLIGISGPGSTTAWWTPWTAERTVLLPKGDHKVVLQQIGWSGTDSGCKSQLNSYSAAKLTVEAY